MLILRRTLTRIPPFAGRWAYLGADPGRVAECRARLGAESRLDVSECFQRIAAELRRPFLDAVARTGSIQKDRIGWCASSFAFKNPTASQLFLLCCQVVLVEELREGEARQGDILVLMDDPWLYEECRRRAAQSRAPIDAGSPAWLWAAKLRLLLRGGFSRVHWLFRTLRALSRQWRASRRAPPPPERVDALLYSLPHARCFAIREGWKDPFLGDLDRILRASGFSVGRLAPMGTIGFETELAGRSDYVYPLILECTGSSLWRAFTAFWKPEAAGFQIQGMDLSMLAEREWWVDLGYARWCEYRLFLECARRLMRRICPSVVIYPYESLSWEKMLVVAARPCGAALLGYQHALTGSCELNYYLGGGEADWAPLPDFILTAGAIQRDRLISEGTPASRCIVAGSLRYGHLRRSLPDSPSPRGDARRRVLVVIGHQRDVAESMLEALNESFADRGEADGLAFYFRPHPTLDTVGRAVAGWMTEVRGELASRLPEFDVVLAMGTTAVLEARLSGLPVVVYRPEALVDSTDISDQLPQGSVLTARDRDLREQVLRAARLGRLAVPPELMRLRDDLFADVDEQAWLECLRPRPIDVVAA